MKLYLRYEFSFPVHTIMFCYFLGGGGTQSTRIKMYDFFFQENFFFEQHNI